MPDSEPQVVSRQELTSRCGPHCTLDHHIVAHCARCHEEFDWPMYVRPGHGANRVLSGGRPRND
jgi:hypothetical protein